MPPTRHQHAVGEVRERHIHRWVPLAVASTLQQHRGHMHTHRLLSARGRETHGGAQTHRGFVLAHAGEAARLDCTFGTGVFCFNSSADGAGHPQTLDGGALAVGHGAHPGSSWRTHRQSHCLPHTEIDTEPHVHPNSGAAHTVATERSQCHKDSVFQSVCSTLRPTNQLPNGGMRRMEGRGVRGKSRMVREHSETVSNVMEGVWRSLTGETSVLPHAALPLAIASCFSLNAQYALLVPHSQSQKG